MTDDTTAVPAPDSDLEARLRRTLVARAGDAPVGGADWGVLAARLASATRRRQRVLAGAAGVALLVGAAGGYLGEAAATPGPLAARSAGSGSKAQNGTSTGAGRTLSPSGLAAPLMCPGATGGSSGSELGTAIRAFIRTTGDGVTIRVYQVPQVGVSCLESPTPLAGAGGTPSGSSSVSSGTASSSGSARSSGSVSSSGAAGSSGSSIMQIVPTTPEVTVELSDDNAVGQGVIASPECIVSPGLGATAQPGATGGSVVPPTPAPGAPTPTTTTPTTTTTESPTTTTTTTTTPTTTTTTSTTIGPSSEPRQLTTGTFGIQEGDPVWWVGVEVGSTVTSVRMTFPDGSTDQMAPVGGIAVLARRITPSVASADPGPYVVRGTLQLLGAGGAVVDTVTLPQSAPVPVPLPGAVGHGALPVAPGAMVACPQAATTNPQAQSSSTTEKR